MRDYITRINTWIIAREAPIDYSVGWIDTSEESVEANSGWVFRVFKNGAWEALQTADLEANVYRYCGTKQTYEQLPGAGERSIGDVYNVIQAHGSYPAGTNYAWNGTEWDALGGLVDLSGFMPKTGATVDGPISIDSIVGNDSAGVYIDGESGINISFNAQPTYTELYFSRTGLHIELTDNTNPELPVTQYFKIDGENGIVIESPRGSHLYNLVSPTNSGDAANKQYVDEQIDNVPFEKGIGTNSAQQKNTGVYAVANGSFASGYGTSSNSSFTVTGSANATTYTTNTAHNLEVGDAVGFHVGLSSEAISYVTEVVSTTSFKVANTLSSQGLSGVRIQILSSAATGQYSSTQGYQTKAINTAEHAEGTFNKSNKKEDGTTEENKAGSTLHSVGFGDSDNTRKNAFEIMQNGDAYLYGLGGYDGTNPNASGVRDIKDVINSKGTYSKPAGGIPATDLAAGVIPDISGKEDKSNKVTIISASSTDTQYPSAKCVWNSIFGAMNDNY